MTGYVFYPSLAYIVAISQGVTTTITFSEDHDFTPGEVISFRISPPFGMVQLNNVAARVQSITPTTVTVNIDSRNFTPFVYPVSGPVSPPIAVPSASGIIPGSSPATVNLQDAFDNLRT